MGSTDAFADPPSAPQFSAEILRRDGSGSSVGRPAKLYVANRKVRIETPDLPGSYFLVDGSTEQALLARPTQRTFTDAKQSSGLTRLFIPVDPDDPCPQWRAAAEKADLSIADWRCERVVGGTSSDGRNGPEYQVVSAGQESHLWIDRELEFPVKQQTADGATIVVENIRREVQPESLFTIPASYRKFDPQALVERIKQSDVWVEPPN